MEKSPSTSVDPIEELLSSCVMHFVSIDPSACEFFIAKDNPLSSCLTIGAIHHFVSGKTPKESCHIHRNLDAYTINMLHSISIEIQFQILERERLEE